MQYTCMQYLCQTSQIASIQICIYPSSIQRSPSLHSAKKVYLQNKGFFVAQTWSDVASLSISQRAVTWMLSLDSSVNRCSLCTFCCFQSTGALFVRPFSVNKTRCFLCTCAIVFLSQQERLRKAGSKLDTSLFLVFVLFRCIYDSDRSMWQLRKLTLSYSWYLQHKILYLSCISEKPEPRWLSRGF